MGKYSKLIAAAAGLAGVLLVDFLHIGGSSENVAETLLALATAFGVYQARNA